jgi:hypothetical protein
MFQPGKSGNPAGRPKTPDSFTELVDKRLGKQGKVEIAKHLVEKARAGNEQAIFCLVSLLQEKNQPLCKT